PVKLYTHLIGDPQYHGRPGDRLSFAVRGEFTADGLKLTVIEKDRSLYHHPYTAIVPASDLGPDWRQVTLRLEQFKDQEGRSPQSWAVIDKLELLGSAAKRTPPRFAQWRWTQQP
ncbi:MAG: hypothetical protein JSS02_28915, partial [Planctomycetes bacterium]|nr:hypothetical protein [Planctomycetota bacterium]